MSVGLAAQTVQRSAFPSRYATAEPLARTLFRALADVEALASIHRRELLGTGVVNVEMPF
jgi:TRAP-type C4-dicarboxylate transport system permease small subunit